jgi:nicotinamide-nucleotide amidase
MQMTKDDAELPERIGQLADTLMAHSLTLAVAESLTGGMLTSHFAAGPNAAKWLQGGLVAYHSKVKREVLGISDGPVVSKRAALEMARGAAGLFGADVALAVTGVGGPESQDGELPGTVWMAVRDHAREESQVKQFEGDPSSICEQACEGAIALVDIFVARVEVG